MGTMTLSPCAFWGKAYYKTEAPGMNTYKRDNPAFLG